MLGKYLFFGSSFKVAACASLGLLVASTAVSTVAVSLKNTKISDVIDVEKFKENLKTFQENLSAGFLNSKAATIEIWNYSKIYYGTASTEFVKLKNFLVTSSAKVSEFFKNISPHFKTFKGYLSTGWSYISSGAKSAYTFLSNYINLENIKKIPNWISSAYQSLKPKLKPAWNWISTNIFSMQNLKDVWEKIKNVKKNFFGTSEFSFDNIKEWGKTWYRVTTKILYPWTKTTIQLSQQGEDFTKLWQYAKEWLNFQELFREGSTFFRNYQGILGGMDDQQRETIFKEFLKNPQEFVEKLKILNKPQEGNTRYSSTENSLSGENLKNLLSRSKEDIEKVQKFQDSVGRATTEVKKLVDSGSKVGEAAAKAGEAVVQGVADQIKNSTGMDVSGVAEGAGKVLQEGAKVASKITNSVVKGVTDLFSSLFSF